MKLTDKNVENLNSLMSLGLFNTEEHAINFTVDYAFNSHTYIETIIDLENELLKELEEMAEEGGLSVNFLLNRILKRYLDSERDVV